ncbi:tripeptidyl peptidase A [Mycena metata]|uniref:tripeptidyl-peptidase II n=1 Tax=Mycena metata TaxID=1033252 RepID=A0AAD7NE65_9AGAR|nr:tripeptidyl peptidase A [Mycena metata]
MKLSLLPLFLFAAISSASPTAFTPQDKTLLVKESVATPHRWTRLGRAPSDHSIRLRIAILQHDFSGLEKALYEISDPDHHRYGGPYVQGGSREILAPNSTSLAFVDGWLAFVRLSRKRPRRSPAKDWVSVNAADIHGCRQMLGYRKPKCILHVPGDVLARTTSYQLPRYLHEHIELASPPQCSRDRREPRATKKNAIGITGFLNEYANIRDLAAFYRDQLPAAVNSTFEAVSVYGGINNQTSAAGEEANLDTQFAFGIAYPTPGIFWSTEGTRHTNEPYLDWLDYILNSHQIPQTISTSYGDDEQTVPFTYARRVCQRFASLAAGVSVLFASGDGGVGDGDSEPAQQCYTNDGKHTRRFIPGFPAVTAVGGTTNIPEISASFSGGGFSDYFARPAYQHKAVSAYLDKLPHKTYDGLFNRAGRGIPDVSAQSRRFQIVWQGERILIGGTSASTPAFAGLVALLNDARLAAGRPALGFLNPMLYKHGAHALNDIVVGSNPGCGTSGFNATQGWDPATGLGTPDFRKLLDVVV